MANQIPGVGPEIPPQAPNPLRITASGGLGVTDTSTIPSNSLKEDSPTACPGDFHHIYHLARVAAEQGVEWPLPGDLIRTVRGSQVPITINMIRKEFVKVLASPCPSRFFRVQRAADYMCDLFDPVWRLIGAKSDDEWSRFGDAWDHTMRVLDRAREPDLDCSPSEIMASLGLYFRMAERAHNPALISYCPIDYFCGRFGPKYMRGMYGVSDNRPDLHNFYNLGANSILNLWHAARASVRLDVEGFAKVCQADAQASSADLTYKPYPQRKSFLEVAQVIRKTDLSDIRGDREKICAARIQSILSYIEREKMI